MLQILQILIFAYIKPADSPLWNRKSKILSDCGWSRWWNRKSKITPVLIGDLEAGDDVPETPTVPETRTAAVTRSRGRVAGAGGLWGLDWGTEGTKDAEGRSVGVRVVRVGVVGLRDGGLWGLDWGTAAWGSVEVWCGSEGDGVSELKWERGTVVLSREAAEEWKSEES